MSLIICKECQKEISSTATSCPHCGFKQSSSIGCYAFIFIILIFFAAAAYLIYNKISHSETSPNQDSLNTTTVQPQQVNQKPDGSIKKIISKTFNKLKNEIKKTDEAQNNSSTLPALKKYNVGEKFQHGILGYTINEVTSIKNIGNETLKKSADGKYLLIKLTIKNTGNVTKLIDNSLFSLIDSKNKTYLVSGAASSALEKSGVPTLFLKQCHPNIETSGTIAFEIPEYSETYCLKIFSGFINNDSVLVIIPPIK